MTLLFQSEVDPAEWWKAELVRRMPELDVRVWPDAGAIEDIEYALVWRPPPGMLARLPNLRAIFSLGAGVDHLFSDPDLPASVPITRLVDVNLTARMTEYVLLHVLRYHRLHETYTAAQATGHWEEHIQPASSDRRIGILGQGVLGGAAGTALAELGFDVAGLSRTPKAIPGLANFHGVDGLAAIAGRSDILINMLPLTPVLEDILDVALFDALPNGAVVINVGRGAHLVEGDLLAALESGKIQAATLDVFRTEPLPAGHPFWAHPAVTITPHVASAADPRTVVEQVAENIRRSHTGEPLIDTVDPTAGY